MASSVKDYVPTTQSKQSAWAQNFSAQINASPGAYALSAADATTIANAANDYSNAYTTAVNPPTRTPVTVEQKNAMRAASFATLRAYAQLIQNTPGISADLKAAAGIRVKTTTRSPINVPTTAPLLAIVGSIPMNMTLRFADSNSPASRSKPFGAAGLQLAVGVSALPLTDPALASITQVVSKNPFGQSFLSGDIGKFATFFGRWMNKRGDTGPWSAPVAMTVSG